MNFDVGFIRGEHDKDSGSKGLDADSGNLAIASDLLVGDSNVIKHNNSFSSFLSNKLNNL